MTAPTADARARRGPIDGRVLALSAALRVHLVRCGVLAVAVAAAVLVQAEALARLLPRLIDGDGGALAPLVGWLALVAAVRGLAAAGADRSATATLVATRRTIRRRVLDRLRWIGPDHRDELPPAQVRALATSAPDALEPWIRAYLPGLTIAATVPLAAGLRILGADLASAAVLIVVVPLIPVFMVLIGWATEARADKQWAALTRLADRFADVLAGLPTLRLFGRADAQVARVREVTERYRAATMRTLRVAFLSAVVLELLATLSVALVAVSLGYRLTRGSIDLQTALVVLLLTPECLLPIRRVAAAFHAATAGVDAATSVHDALAVPVRPQGATPMPAAGRLVLRGVGVADPARGVRLAPVDLEVGPGELVALSGPSGAGKSTLLEVARGALVPTEGTARWGDVDVVDLAEPQRSRTIAWVTQRPQPLGSTVAASVALGHEADASDAAVADALDRLGLAPLADHRPDEVSGGERRRVALARALVGAETGTAAVLLVDEPTAQLDEASAARVVDALRWAADRGVAVVAATHDPRLVAAATRTVAVRGAAREPGTPAAPAMTEGPRPTLDTAPVPEPVAAELAPIDGDEPDDVRGALRWVLAAARAARGRLAGALALGVLAEACAVGLVGTAAWLVVRAAEQPSFADLAVAAVAVRAFGLGKGVIRYAERLTSHDATFRVLADLRAAVVARLARLAPTGLPRDRTGDVLGRLVDDIDRLQDLFLRVLAPLVATAVVAAGTVVVVGLLDPAAGAALAAAALLAGGLLPAGAHRAARRRAVEGAEARGELGAGLVALATDAEELAAAGAYDEARADIDAAADRLDAVDLRQGRLGATVVGLGAAAPAAAAAAVIAAAGPAGAGLSGPALGVVALVPLAVMEMLTPTIAAGEALARVQASAARVVALVRRPDPVAEPEHPAPAPSTGDLALDGVAVGWPDGPVELEGVDLAVAEGERAVVAGPSGSGKSTLAAAMVGFLAPRSGTYAVGGAPATAIGTDAVRELVTWCQQDPWFAATTVADNLRVARPDATDDELWAALAIVHLDAWARALPAGLDTPVSRDAGSLSGGERQRLALARALVGRRRAVVLDEPTAHLDAATAAAVLDDLLAATADRAVVLLGHADAEIGPRATVRLEPRADGPTRAVAAAR